MNLRTSILLSLAAATPLTAQDRLFEAVGSGGNLRLGTSPVVIPDLDGDGRADFAFGRPAATANGRVEVWSSATPPTRLATLQASSPGSGPDEFGVSIDIGRFDGDAVHDLVVGAPGAATVEVFSGAAIAAAGGGSVASFTTFTGTPGSGFGVSIAVIRDSGGDGHAEVLVGTRTGAPAELRAHTGATIRSIPGGGSQVLRIPNLDADTVDDWAVIQGSNVVLFASSLNTTTSATRPGSGHLAVIGDVDADGLSELAAPVGIGGVAVLDVVLGPPSSFVTAMTIPAPLPMSGFGDSICGVGDLDGDGRDDLAIASSSESNPNHTSTSAAGAVRVFSGATGAILTVHRGRDPFEFLGSSNPASGQSSLASGGDLDGDGFADLWIGSPQASFGAANDFGALRVDRLAPVTARLVTGSGASSTVHLGRAAVGLVLGGGARGAAVTCFRETIWFDDAGTIVRRVPAPVPSTADTYGLAIANVGDWDGGGADDVAVGDTNLGVVQVLSTETGLELARATATGTPTPPLGRALHAVDVTNDGRRELIAADAAAIHVFEFAPASGTLTTIATRTGLTAAATVDFAPALEDTGVDLDGDGCAELVVGDPGTATTSGTVRILSSTIRGTGVLAAGQLASDTGPTGTRFGHALAHADFDGDGIHELLVGAPDGRTLPGGFGVGFVRLIVLQSTPPAVSIALRTDIADVFPPTSIRNEFGREIEVVGDWEGGGVGDVAVAATGAPQRAGRLSLPSGTGPTAPLPAGRVAVLSGEHLREIVIGGAPGPLVLDERSGEATFDTYGFALAAAVDGAGAPTPALWVGSPGSDGGSTDEGGLERAVPGTAFQPRATAYVGQSCVIAGGAGVRPRISVIGTPRAGGSYLAEVRGIGPHSIVALNLGLPLAVPIPVPGTSCLLFNDGLVSVPVALSPMPGNPPLQRAALALTVPAANLLTGQILSHQWATAFAPPGGPTQLAATEALEVAY